MSDQVETIVQETQILYQFLCIALGGNAYLHPSIDDCYRKNEWAYYEAYQQSEWKDNPLFSTYTTKSEEKIRQVAGLMEWCTQNQQFSPLDQLIKKGYKFVYHYSKQRTEIDFEHFMRCFAKKQKGKMVKEIELLYQNIILWYLCVRENKLIQKDSVAWHSFQRVLNTSVNESKLQKLMFSKEKLKEHQEEIEELYEEFHIPKNPRFDSVGCFLEYFISHHLTKMVEANPSSAIEKTEQLVFQETPAKYVGAIGGWLKTLNIHELDATEQIPFTKMDLDLVFLELLYAKKYNYISRAEQDLFFLSCLYLKCISSLYQETKQLYLDESKLDYYIDMKFKESRIKEQEDVLFRQQREWTSIYQRQAAEIDGLSRELREAQAKIRQLEQQLEKMEDYADEVHALRSYAHCEEQVVDDFPPLETMTAFIQTKRIAIFGGSPNWQQRIKECLPHVEFVDVDERNRDISRIQRMDAVFINTTVFSHAFYKKIMKELSHSETPLFYLNGQRNREKTIVEIYKWLTE